MRHIEDDDLKPNTLKDVLTFARNTIIGAAAVTVAVAIPAWALIGTIKAARIIFGV